ncbi:MAG: hypothetical protein JNL10_03475 [Verrucomicrobiales bacterium]|nr:hypothetical protein [Verrucomicrobiales bacterium]
MKSESKPGIPGMIWVLVAAGLLLPVVSVMSAGGGLRGFFAHGGLLRVVWGGAPFVLFPLAARYARRGWVRRMVVALALVTVLAGFVGYLRLLPQREGNAATLLLVFIPIWQWPASILAAMLAVFVPSEAQESEETRSAASGA